MVKTNQNQIEWKPISINDPILTSEGLIAIEECRDYNITHVAKKSQVIKRKNSSKNKSNRRKCTSLKPSKNGSSTRTKVQTLQPGEILQGFEAWSNFAIPSPIIRSLSIQGFREPTLIQSLTLPAAILGHKDIVGAAATGSGKTLAFGLPMLTAILNEKDKAETCGRALYGIVLTPTRELAIQVKDHLIAAAKFTNINIAVVIGGLAAVKQERILRQHPEIVVATPGRLWELIQQGNEHLSHIDNIKFLAIDETDRMLEKGHFEELHMLLERLNTNKNNSAKRQNFIFSATLTVTHDLPKYVFKKSRTSKMTPQQKLQKIIDILGITDPKIVDVTRSGVTPETLTECRINCLADEKDYYLYYFLQKYPGRTLIFCNSVGCVKRLKSLLNCLECQSLPLHATMQQKDRLKSLERDDERGILIATDVAARGLDIPKIDHVLHYQTPRTGESYIHRSGRTARVAQKGITVLLIDPSEIHNYIKLCKTLNKNEDLPLFPVQNDYFKAVKERVDLARELDQLELKLRKHNSEKGWLQKAAQEMDIILDDCDYDDGFDKSKQKKTANIKKKQLMSLLRKPVFPQGFTGKYPLNIGDFFHKADSALQVMQDVIEPQGSKRKIKNLPLFKPTKKNRKNYLCTVIQCKK